MWWVQKRESRKVERSRTRMCRKAVRVSDRSVRTLTLLCYVLAAGTTCILIGCGLLPDRETLRKDTACSHYQHVATQIEYPNVMESCDDGMMSTPPPMSLSTEEPKDYWNLTLEEAVQLALVNSQVLRNLGGTILRSPTTTQTVHDPAIRETDPRYGVAAALSAFDASFATTAFFEGNDRLLNNTFYGGGTRSLEQDAAVFQSQITKLAATGTELTVRSNTDYDSNNAPGNQFTTSWNTNIEAEFRHPLFQGGGVNFNRIAGPSDVPGVMNGVVVARINTDISLVDFEIGVRDFVSNIENAYWDLYFAYRDLDAKIEARDTALETWRRVQALYTAGRRGGEAEKEAQAREQYYRFQEDVQNALTGRLVERTQTSNGSSAGTFRATGGVYTAERRLRLMMGLSINEDRLIRPSDEPIQARIEFNWEESLIESLTRRAELRRQKWLVERREQELEASQNFLLPTFDVVGRYRWRGFGHDLLKQHSGAPTTRGGGLADVSVNNAFENMTSGSHQEWQLGFELEFPFGRRRAHSGVRNAELLLARERTILKEQEREIVHDLSNAFSETQRSYAVLETNYNRLIASREQLAAVEAAFEADKAQLDVVLDAQRRVAESGSAYYRSLVEYGLAVKNVHFEKGSLLEYCGVALSEGLWPIKAYYDAKQRRDSTINMEWLDPILVRPHPISRGEYPQVLVPIEWEEPSSLPEPVAPEPVGRVEQAGFEEPADMGRSSVDEMARPEIPMDAEQAVASPLLREAAAAPIKFEWLSLEQTESGSPDRRVTPDSVADPTE